MRYVLALTGRGGLRARPLSREPQADVQKEEKTEIEEEKREDQGEKESAADVAVVSFEEAFTKPTSFWAQFALALVVLEIYHTQKASSQFGCHSQILLASTCLGLIFSNDEIKRSFSSSVDESVDIRDVSLGSNVSFVGLDWKSFYVRAMCGLTGQ